MKSSRMLQFFDRNAWWALALAYMSLLCAVAPLRTAFQFGGDEGYELMKSLLVSRGYGLYDPIWDDQPPLFTLLLGELFRCFGPSILVARLFVVGFAGVLVGGLYAAVRHRSGPLAAGAAAMLVIGSSSFCELSVSVMTELPAMALGLLSVVVLFRHCRRQEWTAGDSCSAEGEATKRDSWVKRNGWLVLAGFLFGCALQIKFTAAIFVPAIVVEILRPKTRPKARQAILSAPVSSVEQRQTGLSASRWRERARALLIWCVASFATVAALSAAFWSKESWAIFWQAHFSGALRAALGRAGTTYLFRPDCLLADYGLCLAALAGLVLILRTRRWDLLFPGVLLLTALLTHIHHEPYWYYYYLHFAIPLAWMAGIGIEGSRTELWNREPTGALGRLSPWFAPVAWLFMMAVVVVGWLEGISNGLTRVANSASVSQVPLSAALMANRTKEGRVFADRGIYAFHAGMSVPPELAVLSKKRFWTGQISATEIAFDLRLYHPGLILLAGSVRQDFTFVEGNAEHHVVFNGDAVGHYLNEDYDEIFHDRTGSLYTRKGLASQMRPKKEFLSETPNVEARPLSSP